jgi:PIN like domain
MKSRRSSGRRRDPEPPPEFLIDRSLSQVSLPASLREAGLIVRTLSDVYGEQEAQRVQDTAWIALAAERGWVILCKDDHIRRRPAERQALQDGKVKVFCLTNARLTFAEQASYFLTNRFRILQACRKRGPFLYGVYRDRITRLWPVDN